MPFFCQIMMGNPIKTQNYKGVCNTFHFTFTILDAWHLKVTHFGFVGVSRRIWLYFIKISFKRQKVIQKYVNLQNNMLVCWADGTNDSSTKRLMLDAMDLGHSKPFFYFCNFIKKNKKTNWKGFCKEFCKILWKKNNTWNIRCLVNESFIPSAQWTSILYCRLTDF